MRHGATEEILKHKKAVLFDLDGTLVDSMWVWKDIDIDFLGRYGHPCPGDLVQKVAGMSFTETASYFKERFHLPLAVGEITDCWTRMAMDRYRSEVTLKPGAREFLTFLRDRGIRAGIATSNGRGLVDAVVEARGIGGFFQEVATACEVAAGKPEPDIYLEVARRLSVLPEECLVMEDIPEGILAGKRAKMTVCAVDDAFSRSLEETKRELADYFIGDYFELLGAIEGRAVSGRALLGHEFEERYDA